jgi:nitrate/nitrite transporter NarK
MQLVALLIVAALVVKFWPYIVGTVAGIVVIVWLVRYGMRAADLSWEREQSKRRRLAELAARADQQHEWVMRGDPRGTYGEYPAAPMDHDSIL